MKSYGWKMKYCMPRFNIRLWYIVLCCISPGVMYAQDLQFPVWQSDIPCNIYTGGKGEDTITVAGGIRIKNVTIPTLTLYKAAAAGASGAAVIICPGGSYERLAINSEGHDVARWFAERGINAFVLKYRLPADSLMLQKSTGPLMDVQEAIRTVRMHAEEWRVNPGQIGIVGFSAGGHLAASASTLYDDSVYSHNGISARPDFSILIYPVISMLDSLTHKKSKRNLLGAAPDAETVRHFSTELQANKFTPPAFLVHSLNDSSVIVTNSRLYYQALLANGVEAELHTYSTGGHGYGIKGKGGDESNWPLALEQWLIVHKFCSALR